MAVCIWCRQENDDFSVEHIIPDALGCPSDFVLTGGLVCRTCNNGLGHLDQAVIDDFDFLAFMNNVPKKGGRPPAVQNRGNALAKITDEGPVVALNMETYPVSSPIGKLSKKGASRRSITAELSVDHSMATVEFSTSIGSNPKFGRGMAKIGFSSAVYFLGPERFYGAEHNSLIAYVKEGIGKPRVLMRATEDTNYRNQSWPPWLTQTGTYVSVVRIAVCEFVVDLSPDCSAIEQLRQEAIKQGESHFLIR